MKLLVTGGAGFIGSSFLLQRVPVHPEHTFVNVDSLTYAGNLRSLEPVQAHPNYRFERCDIADPKAVEALFARHEPDGVLHFAAESHVDRSIASPGAFIQTNVVGTFNLLEACRARWLTAPHKALPGKLFHHVSTDEVYGSLGETGAFTEETRYNPSSPYSASKASSDFLVRAYHATFGLPVKITNCSNNYGPRQFPEKLIPLMIQNALEDKPLPVYGKGINVRDWLYVEDHCDAIWAVFERGRLGETYNIGGNSERKNIDIVRQICALVAEHRGVPAGRIESLLTYVPDRPGHDLRYAIDPTKIRTELGWSPRESFETGLRKTVAWYLANQGWVNEVRTGDYRRWMETNYGARGRS